MIKITDIKTPCYIADTERFKRNVCDLRDAYSKHYDNFRFGYSYKTSYYNPYLIAVNELGECAEVVSDKEYKKAVSIGVEEKNIIYNGVIPSVSKVSVIEHGGIVNVENLQELHDLVIDHNVKKIGIRVCFEVGNSLCSRFGFDVLSNEYYHMVEFIEGHDIEISCVHCHISQARDIDSFKKRIINMIDVANQLNADAIDIGGNMYGRIHDDKFKSQFKGYATFEEYGEVVGKEMAKAFPNKDKTLIAEGGTPVVSDTISIVFTVIAVKTICGQTYITVDGRLSDAGFACKYKSPPYRHYGKERNLVRNAYIVGCSCVEEDLILRGYNGYANVGDKIVIDNIGAYSYNLVNDFITDGCRKFYELNEILWEE